MRGKNQQLLLSRNTPLYIQLYIAYNLGKVFGFDHEQHERRFSAKVHWFDAGSKLFRRNADLQYYSQLISELHSTLRLTSPRARAVLAYVILFDLGEVPTDMQRLLIGLKASKSLVAGDEQLHQPRGKST